MTGISYKATVIDEEMRAELARLIDRMENAAEFYKNVGDHLMFSLSERFDAQTAPDGTPWAPLSPVTIARREAAGQLPTPILRASGVFREEFSTEADDTQVRVGTSAVQGAMMHFGGMSKGYMKAYIPARPILGLTEADETEIFAIAQDWLATE